MEIEQQPSPWPCVVMLAGLLLCCLAAPCYWQRGQAKMAPSNEAADAPRKQLDIATFSFRAVYSSLENNYALKQPSEEKNPNLEILSLWVPPSIEELVAAHANVNQFQPDDPLRDPTSVPWLPYANSASVVAPFAGQEPASPAAEQPPQYAMDVFVGLGAAIADYLPVNIAADCVARFADAISRNTFSDVGISQIIESTGTPPTKLHFLSPEDRSAMLPAAPRGTPWCVPQTLYEQLYRLAGDPHTAAWASRVANQLHSVADRERLAGADVPTTLADLSDAAQEALQLADSTDDDRLRVELLRTHWALVRRLDCWNAMFEEHVAYRVREHVAARGDLGPYFNNSPDNSPTPEDLIALSNSLEAYETTRDPLLAAQVVQQQRVLAASPAAFDRAMADAVEQHYRNANVRVAISAAMINRLVGPERAESRPVRDRIAGAYVHGDSEITARSRVELAPADNEWNLKVQTNGVVESRTSASSGPVRLRSHGATDFHGSKTVVVRPDGVHLRPSDVEANASNRLVGVTTDYDWLPIIGSYARDRALQEYRARRNRVRTEMELRVTSEASETLDRETHEALEQARQKLYARFTQRVEQYGIKMTTVEMKSTADRLVARVRVAGDEQLGSNTPRPRALSDSLASVQVHETALTNLAVTLGLDGQRLTGAELREKIQQQFPQLKLDDKRDANRDTVFHFAAKNAVGVHVQDGKLELVLRLDRVELDGDQMPGVIVHAHYKPLVDGLHAQLEREGALGIEGRFSAGERARLHNIFQTVLPPERALQIVRLDDPENGRDKVFAGLMITQFVMEDGWVGLSLGPQTAERVAERFRSLR